MVAAVCSWHERHETTRKEIERRRRAQNELVLAAHSMIETYAVLTRLPPPHRFSVQDALTLIESNWGEAEVFALTPSEYWKLLRECRDEGFSGGQVYDAVIAACARKAGAERLLTWNLDHFSRFQGHFTVTTPDLPD